MCESNRNTKQKPVFRFVFWSCYCQVALSGQLGREAGMGNGWPLSLKCDCFLPATTQPSGDWHPQCLILSFFSISRALKKVLLRDIPSLKPFLPRDNAIYNSLPRTNTPNLPGDRHPAGTTTSLLSNPTPDRVLLLAFQCVCLEICRVKSQARKILCTLTRQILAAWSY